MILRSLLQQDEDASGAVSTQHGQAARRKIGAGLAGDAGLYTNSSKFEVQELRNVRGFTSE